MIEKKKQKAAYTRYDKTAEMDMELGDSDVSLWMNMCINNMLSLDVWRI